MGTTRDAYAEHCIELIAEHGWMAQGRLLGHLLPDCGEDVEWQSKY